MTDSAFPLLHNPENLLDTNTWFCRVPIVGWMTAYSRQLVNEGNLVDQVPNRGLVPPEAWTGRAHDPEIRKRLTEIVVECAYAKGSEFHPDDPFELMMVLRYGDLNECEIMIDIEREYGIKFTEEVIDWLIDEKVTFLQFIHYMQENQRVGSSSS